MSSFDVQEKPSTVGWDVIDHNVIPDLYTVYIVDIWDGDRNDPAVTVERFIGVWSADSLEDEEGNAIDPDWSKYNVRSYYSQITPEAIRWDRLETVKAADREAKQFKEHSDAAVDTEHYRYNPGNRKAAQLYKEFLIGVDMLAKDDKNEQAWEMVEAYRTYQAQRHEK